MCAVYSGCDRLRPRTRGAPLACANELRVTLARMVEIRRAFLAGEPPEPAVSTNEMLTLIVCAERWLRWAAEIGEAWQAVEADTGAQR